MYLENGNAYYFDTDDENFTNNIEYSQMDGINILECGRFSSIRIRNELGYEEDISDDDIQDDGINWYISPSVFYSPWDEFTNVVGHFNINSMQDWIDLYGNVEFTLLDITPYLE